MARCPAPTMTAVVLAGMGVLLEVTPTTDHSAMTFRRLSSIVR